MVDSGAGAGGGQPSGAASSSAAERYGCGPRHSGGEGCGISPGYFAGGEFKIRSNERDATCSDSGRAKGAQSGSSQGFEQREGERCQLAGWSWNSRASGKDREGEEENQKIQLEQAQAVKMYRAFECHVTGLYRLSAGCRRAAMTG